MFTFTLYGISVSIAAFVTWGYVLLVPASTVTIMQGAIFVVASAVFSYLLPRWFAVPRGSGVVMGLDAHIGKTYPLLRVGTDWKVKIYGVDYLIAADSVDESFQVGMLVRIDAVESGILVVSRV